ncbi:RES domain-containing protein [Arthrobacter sp. VKM Ac-2550]|uniref:RES domain-containing protein n=1 Tax=Crystallibacter permensis TaxID=1938888 RepID=UPI002226134E|nr:RES domain-containing protein [Arthrobacter sp. VKM Ac-2550]
MEEQGYSDIEGYLCLAHVEDSDLEAALSAVVLEGTCSLCDAGAPGSDAQPVIPLQVLLAEVMDAVVFLYEPAEGIAYLATRVDDTIDVLQTVCSGYFSSDIEDSLIDRFDKAIHTLEWVASRHGHSLEAAQWGWETFVSDVSSESRFIYMSPAEPEHVASPGQRSAAFLQSLLPYAEEKELGLLATIPTGTPFYRGRLVQDQFDQTSSADDLGPAPAHLAAANRMSPEGISMFYGSESAITAIREIAAHGTRKYARIGAFKNKRELVILDLTRIPALPSIFDKQSRPKYGVYQFFANFRKNVAAPLHPDGRPHMQYLPTQVVTEFFRWVPRTKIDGIKLFSAQDGTPTYVLFVDRSEVADELQEKDQPSATLLAKNIDDTGASDRRPVSTFDDLSFYRTDPVLTLHPADVKTYKVVRNIEATLLS